MIWKPGSLVTKHSENLSPAPIVLTTKQELLMSSYRKFQRMSTQMRTGSSICLTVPCVLLRGQCAASWRTIRLKTVSKSPKPSNPTWEVLTSSLTRKLASITTSTRRRLKNRERTTRRTARRHREVRNKSKKLPNRSKRRSKLKNQRQRQQARKSRIRKR